MLDPNSINDRKSLLAALAEAQSILSINREHRISTDAMTGIYRALEWCSQNFDISEGTASYIRGNFNAVGGHDWESSLSNIAAKKINDAQQQSDARSGEAEYGLRSLMQILKEAKLKSSEKAMLSVLIGYLRNVISESNSVPKVS